MSLHYPGEIWKKTENETAEIEQMISAFRNLSAAPSSAYPPPIIDKNRVQKVINEASARFDFVTIERLFEAGASLPNESLLHLTVRTLEIALSRGYRFPKSAIRDIVFSHRDVVEKLLKLFEVDPSLVDSTDIFRDEYLSELIRRLPVLAERIRTLPSDSEERKQIFERGFVETFRILDEEEAFALTYEEAFALCVSGRGKSDLIIDLSNRFDIPIIEVVLSLIQNEAIPSLEDGHALFTGEVVARLIDLDILRDNENDTEEDTRRDLFLRFGVLYKDASRVTTAKRLAVEELRRISEGSRLSAYDYAQVFVDIVGMYRHHIPGADAQIEKAESRIQRTEEIHRMPTQEREALLQKIRDLEKRHDAEWKEFESRQRSSAGSFNYKAERSALFKRHTEEDLAVHGSAKYISNEDSESMEHELDSIFY